MLDKIGPQQLTKSVKWSIASIILFAFSMLMEQHKTLEWLGVNDIISFGWCYAFGVCSFHIFGDISQSSFIKNKRSLLSVTGGCFLVAVLIHSTLDANTPIHRVGNMFIAVLMTTSILLICAFFNDKTSINKKSLIAQTYQIFLLSWPCQLVIEVFMERLFHFSWYMIMPCMFILGIIGPLLIIKTIDWFERKTNTHYLSIVIGK